MINQHVIDEINKGIDKGMRFFLFDKRSFTLVASHMDNKGSFYDVNVHDCIEIYMSTHTNIDYLISQLKFYNAII